MNIWLEEFRQNLTIVGFRDVKVSNLDKFFQETKEKAYETVQFFDASLVAGFDHLRFATLNALNAFKNGGNISNKLAMEILLYASAHRQIKEAVRLMGIKTATTHVAVLVVTESQQEASPIIKTVARLMDGKRDDSVVDFTDAKMQGLIKLFEISKTELEAKTERKGGRKLAVMDLIIEHMALLVTQR